jgi:hypothetical protein
MIETRPAQQIEAPKIRHYANGTMRPIVATLPTEPIRVTRSEIEAALRGSNNGNPHTPEIVERIVLETSRMDQHPEGSFMFKQHAETIRRSLRELGLYPVLAVG